MPLHCQIKICRGEETYSQLHKYSTTNTFFTNTDKRKTLYTKYLLLGKDSKSYWLLLVQYPQFLTLLDLQ